MRIRSFFLAVLLAAVSLAALAQEQAFTNRSTELKDKAAADGRTVATLPENTSVKVIGRSGGWTQIDAGAQKGWVRAFHLRFPSTVQASESGGGFSLGGLFQKSSPRQATVATTGIRGLSQEDFQNASPDVAALQRLQSYRVDKGAAERFAREAKLSSVSINYLMDEATSSRGRR